MVILRKERTARVASVGNWRIVDELLATAEGVNGKASIVGEKRTGTLRFKRLLVNGFIDALGSMHFTKAKCFDEKKMW